MPAPVVVEVYAPQPRPQELSALLAACTRAAAPNECVSSEAKSADAPLGVAIVRRDGEHARIELGLRSAPSADWSTRDLVFQLGDDELERYRAIGFAIGTLVARQIEPSPAPPVSKPEPTPAPPPPPPAPPTEPVSRLEPPKSTRVTSPGAPRSAWLDGGGTIGLGLTPGPPRAGGALRGALELFARGLFVVVEGGYAERFAADSLRVRWLNVGAGLGHPLLPSVRAGGLDLRLLVSFEHLGVTATDGERSASDSRWKPGVVAAVDGHWNFAPPLGVVVGASTFIDPERTVVRSAGQELGKTPTLGLSGFVGLRLNLR